MDQAARVKKKLPFGAARLKVRLSPAWRDSLIAFSVGRMLFSLIGYLIWLTGFRPEHADQFYFGIPSVLQGLPGALLGVWQRWDGIHYQRIALEGYSAGYLTVFFPMYPLLSRWLSRLTGLDLLPALIVVSNLAFLFSLVLLYQIVSTRFSPKLARTTLINVLIFPTAFYFYAIYPQSLVLMWILLAYWLTIQKKWAGAGMAALLAGLTHSTAWVLTILIGVEAFQYFKAEGISFKQVQRWLLPLFASGMNGVGIIAFLLWRAWAGFPPFQQVEREAWGWQQYTPWGGVWDIVKSIFSTPLAISELVAWINIGTFLLIIALTLWSFRRIPTAMWLFQLVTLAFLTINHMSWNPLQNFFRFILILFPVYLELALLERGKTGILLKFTCQVILAVILSAMFFLWQSGVS